MKIKSWKTTLGGSLTAAGTALWAIPSTTYTLFPQFEFAKQMTNICVVIGIILAVGGPFVSGLFARDNDVTSQGTKVTPEPKPPEPTPTTVPIESTPPIS